MRYGENSTTEKCTVSDEELFSEKSENTETTRETVSRKFTNIFLIRRKILMMTSTGTRDMIRRLLKVSSQVYRRPIQIDCPKSSILFMEP